MIFLYVSFHPRIVCDIMDEWLEDLLLYAILNTDSVFFPCLS
jgi:hypothetical protein